MGVLGHRFTQVSGRRGVAVGVFFMALLAGWVLAQQPPGGVKKDVPRKLNYSGAGLEFVLDDYSAATGRVILQHPKVPKTAITLQSQGELTTEEYLTAIDSVLAMHNIALLKVGDKFLKVVPSAEARSEGMEIGSAMPEGGLPDSDTLISQLIQLKHIDLKDAQKAIDPLKHPYGKVNLFERTNSLLITDTAANINRFLQIMEHIDQPAEIREVPNVIPIRYAKAADIKKKLEEVIAESQKEAELRSAPRLRTSGSPGVIAPSSPAITVRTPPGVIRPTVPTVATAETVLVEDITAMAERGVIYGKVKIVADDRTNLLIIITRPENMGFFERIVEVLDVPMDPEFLVKIVRLEYANAETVASTLNTLIGKTKTDASAPAAGAPTGSGADTEGRSAALKEYVDQLQKGARTEKEKSMVGELSDANIKILPDKRTNSLLIMASKGDYAALAEIILSMDSMLSQVMIEAVIIQVSLDDTVSSGIHWAQRAIVAYDAKSDGRRVPRGAIAGSAGGGRTGTDTAMGLTKLGSWATSPGLTAYFTHFGLNLEAIMTMLATDSRSKILSAPVIVTTDNTEATLTSSQQKYFLKGSTVDQFGNVRPETEIRDIGLDLKVTPHINQSRNVMMDISQKISDLGAEQDVGTQGKFPTTITRSFNASIAVRDRETIVLGGLVRQESQNSRTGIPILRSIPLLGKLFSADSDYSGRSEVVVFVTPYVLDTPQDIAEESLRRKQALNIEGVWQKGWSDSALAEPHAGSSPSAAKPQDQGGVPLVVTPAEGMSQPEPAAPTTVTQPAPMLDPELADFIQRQEKRWGKTLKESDEDIRQQRLREEIENIQP